MYRNLNLDSMICTHEVTPQGQHNLFSFALPPNRDGKGNRLVFSFSRFFLSRDLSSDSFVFSFNIMTFFFT